MNRSSRFPVQFDVAWVPRAAWITTVALIAAPPARAALTQIEWAPKAVSTLAVAALLMVMLWATGRFPPPPDRIRMRALRLTPPLALLVGLVGGLSVPAVVPAAIWTGAFTRYAGRRSGLIAATALSLALGVVGLIGVGAGVVWSWPLAAALCVASAILAPAIQPGAPTPTETDSTDRPRRRRPSSLTGDVPAISGSASRRGAHKGASAPDAIDADVLALTGFLDDARELLGADDVILWRWSESAQQLRCVALSVRGGGHEMAFPVEEGSALVQRAAREGRVIEGSDAAGRPQMLAGSVDRGERLYGAISVYARAGVALDRDAARGRVARLAAQMGLLLELLEARHRAETEGARTSALLRASEDFQRNLDQHALHRAICERAVQVTGAVRATFVRWDPETKRGDVASATDYERVRPGMEISEDALVSEACRTRQRISVPDVPHPARTRIFAEQEGRVRIGSLAIVPLVHEHLTVGAIVVEAAQRDAIGPEEAATLALLATVAVPSLEASRRLRTASERAFTDPLTGLANRRAFDERLSHLLDTIDRYGGCVSLILVDIDHFKRVNDGYGHDAGDEVLRAVGQLVGSSVRTIDLAARFGGEEIAILLPKTGLDGARELAERLRREVANRPIRVRDQDLRITASFGVACFPETSEDNRVLFTNADAALYEAKASGRNQVKCARQHEGSQSLIEMV